MTLLPDWREFIELLNSHAVDYVIVGAWARAFHGVPRSTGDIDFFVRPSPENADRLIRALNEFGFASIGITHEDFLRRTAWSNWASTRTASTLLRAFPA